jgi:hypothetical protein
MKLELRVPSLVSPFIKDYKQTAILANSKARGTTVSHASPPKAHPLARCGPGALTTRIERDIYSKRIGSEAHREEVPLITEYSAWVRSNRAEFQSRGYFLKV